jgi:pyruvate/2-oxoglutarate dehydrogenase complex dihydrolipoamide acyltransferase (E2) component
MDVEIKVAELGHGSEGGTFTAWLKGVGEPVSAGEPIAEIMTEKANVEVVSPADGVLHAQHLQNDDPFTQETILGIVRSAS